MNEGNVRGELLRLLDENRRERMQCERVLEALRPTNVVHLRPQKSG